MHYLLFYELGEDYVSRRAAFRDAHLEKAWKASERVEFLLGVALANPVDGAVLLFQGNSPKVGEVCGGRFLCNERHGQAEKAPRRVVCERPPFLWFDCHGRISQASALQVICENCSESKASPHGTRIFM
jgi:hypothetical protein